MAEGVPLNGMRYAHKTIRKELAELEQSAADLNPDDREAAAALHGHVVMLGTILRGHTDGEEQELWPALEAKFPQISTPYTLDHRAEQGHVARVTELLAALKGGGQPEDRKHLKHQLHHETIALNASTSLHANKEDAHIIPLTEQNFDLPTQAALSGRMAAGLPREYMPQIMGMVMHSLSPAERADYVGIMVQLMPPQAFVATKGLIENSVSAEEWQDLRSRVPELH